MDKPISSINTEAEIPSEFELSTKLLIQRALSRGISVEVLDAHANFLKLQKGSLTHYVKQATKTAVDSYMTFLIMENKEVCKRILHEAGIRVPIGEQFTANSPLSELHRRHKDKSLVIKPTNTNFGLGIHFLNQNCSLEEFSSAAQNALTFDDTALVEEFIRGNEYRFLVIDYKLLAVCERVPANVVGDGTHTVHELINLKNEDPRRGVDHQLALEKIQITDVEMDILTSQGLSLEYVPESGRQVFLRKNSNISTGGDSYDRTDEIHEGYKELAEAAARAVGTRLTGIDVMIEDPKSPPTKDNHGIIEMNFNPVLYIHEVPYSGTGRPVTDAALDVLGF